MKKLKGVKKLTLSKDTLRTLDREETEKVVGGGCINTSQPQSSCRYCQEN